MFFVLTGTVHAQQPVRVTSLPALAAGTNNIGDVDVLTIAAGNNNIGDVDVASIAAGDNNIGNVDIVSFPDNEPINVAQINGVAVLMGNGASGTGAQRVTIANDSTGIIALTTSTASIGNIANICSGAVSSVAINTASSGNVELVAISGSTVIYVCGYHYVASGTVSVQLIKGTGTACATGEADLEGPMAFVANTGISVPNGGARQYATSAGDALCIELSGAVQVSGAVTYVQQ